MCVVVSHVLVELSDATFERREMRERSAITGVSVNKRVYTYEGIDHTYYNMA